MSVLRDGEGTRAPVTGRSDDGRDPDPGRKRAAQERRGGPARAALRHRDFRILWAGALASNVGTWMQNVALGAYAYELTHSPLFVSIVYFAQMGPLLVLSAVGGLLADTVDRRRLLICVQLEQLIGSAALALLVAGGHSSRLAIVLAVLSVGIGNALNNPAWMSSVPSLVGEDDLSGAVSLHVAQIQASRVIGPAIGGVLFPLVGAAGVFAVNAGTYLFSVATLLVARIPRAPKPEDEDDGLRRRLLAGFSVARHDPLVRMTLLTLFTFALLCVPFSTQLPVVAATNLHMDVESLPYGLLFAAFGFGGVVGAVSVGTFLSGVSTTTIVRRNLQGFAAGLLVFAFLRSAIPAYPVVAILGFTFFSMVTALNTALQDHLDEGVRGRVTAIWFMCFGGTLPLGSVVAGVVAETVSITAVMLYGVPVALALAWYTRGLAGLSDG